jgi:chromosome segregation ATPase
MSSEEFEQRINNKLETIIENQANLQEAIAGLIQVARLHSEQLDQIRQQIADHSEQIKANSEQIKANSEHIDQNRQAIAALTEQGKEQNERINALIRMVEGHLSNHP